MALRQRIWAAKRTKQLRRMLGGKCSCCGTRADLSFDVVDPVGNDHHRKMDYSMRLSFYFRQFRAFNLQLLCVTCNTRKGDFCLDFRSPKIISRIQFHVNQLNLKLAA